jgi:hypothetical protein
MMDKPTRIEASCDRIIHVALAETDPRKQVVILLQWLIEQGQAGTIEVVPPLDVMLGLPPRGQDVR